MRGKLPPQGRLVSHFNAPVARETVIQGRHEDLQ